jgi:hypothetical protein
MTPQTHQKKMGEKLDGTSQIDVKVRNVVSDRAAAS